MLILNRRVGERIVIGTGDRRVTITVLETRPNLVRIGIDAPKEVPVHRQEVYDAINE